MDAARVQREGVSLTVRLIATRYGLQPTHVQRGVQWALDHGLLARRPDGQLPGQYRYALTHPSHWQPTPLSGRGLASVRADGWDAPLLDVTLAGERPDATLSARPMGNSPGAVHTGGHASRARSSSRVEIDLEPKSIQKDSPHTKADGWYFWTGAGKKRERIAVTWWVTKQLEERWPIAFEVLPGKGVGAAPSHVVAELFELLSGATEVRWTIPMLRTAIARAVEQHAVILGDRAEWNARTQERAEHAAAKEAAGRAAELLAEWRNLAPFLALADPESAEWAPRLADAAARGELAEIEVFAAYVTRIVDARDAEDRRQWAAAAPAREEAERARRAEQVAAFEAARRARAEVDAAFAAQRKPLPPWRPLTAAAALPPRMPSSPPPDDERTRNIERCRLQAELLKEALTAHGGDHRAALAAVRAAIAARDVREPAEMLPGCDVRGNPAGTSEM